MYCSGACYGGRSFCVTLVCVGRQVPVCGKDDGRGRARRERGGGGWGDVDDACMFSARVMVVVNWDYYRFVTRSIVCAGVGGACPGRR